MSEDKPNKNAEAIRALLLDLVGYFDNAKSKGNSQILTYRDKKLAFEYVLCAERDLGASKLLYKEGDYPNAIYHLQQGVEKTAKGNAALKYPLHLQEIKQTFHNSPEIFLRLMRKDFSKDLLTRFQKLLPQLAISKLDNLNDIIDNMKKAKFRKEVATISTDIIDELLNICYVMINAGNADFITNALKDQLGLNWTDELKDLVRTISKNNKEVIDELDKTNITSVVSSLTGAVSTTLHIEVPLYILSVITFPHESFTRYPDGELTPNDYTMNLGVVSRFDRIWETSTKACENLKKYMLEKIT